MNTRIKLQKSVRATLILATLSGNGSRRAGCWPAIVRSYHGRDEGDSREDGCPA
jgi:hypothetical protein